MGWLERQSSQVLQELQDNKEQVNRLLVQLEQLTQEHMRYLTRYPPGHFYSPLPDLKEIRKRENELFDAADEEVPGIDFNTGGQRDLLRRLADFQADMPFGETPREGLRYYLNNDYFSYSDGIVLYSMIRHLRPKRILEVGSGYSSAVILDTNELFLDGSIACTFIDPNPERLLRFANRETIDLLECGLQEADPERFRALQENDILFIDSTHVSKVGSDVNELFGRILPSLNKGVVIHLHDIFHPFEYPKHWFYEGMIWNEAYVVRSFLQYNNAFRILFWNDYLAKYHEPEVRVHIGKFMQSAEGASPRGSLWLQKIM